jgi:hypothetical protein
MKVRFIKAWPPYQVGDILELPDAFLGGNQMYSRGIVVKADQDKEPAAKLVETAPVDKMQRAAKTK